MKAWIKRIAQSAGYEIRHTSFATGDPFEQQSRLMEGESAQVIFDVGANVGSVTQEYRRMFPGAMIYAFEPFPGVFSQLERNTQGDPRVATFRVALGSGQGRAALRVNSSSPTNSLLETDDSAMSFWGEGLMETTATVGVELTTIDEFCAANGIADIDILKIDTQGTDLDVLRGAAKMLAGGRIRLVYIEMIAAPTYKGQCKMHEVMGLLDGSGFNLHGLYNLWRREDGRLLQMEAIFVRSEIPDQHSPDSAGANQERKSSPA